MVAVAGGDEGWGDGLRFSSEASAAVCLTWFRRRAEACSDDRLLCPAAPACSANEELPQTVTTVVLIWGSVLRAMSLQPSTAGQPKAGKARRKHQCKLKATQSMSAFTGAKIDCWPPVKAKTVYTFGSPTTQQWALACVNHTEQAGRSLQLSTQTVQHKPNVTGIKTASVSAWNQCPFSCSQELLHLPLQQAVYHIQTAPVDW